MHAYAYTHIAYVRADGAALRLLVVVGSYGLPQTKVANRTVRTRVINCMPNLAAKGATDTLSYCITLR